MNNDMISRRVAIEAISADGFEHFSGCLSSNEATLIELLRDTISEIPAVDAVVLPCKVGDTVWGIRNYKGINHPQQGKVDQMYYTNDMRLHIKIKHICIGEWGKKIFPTREEAEAALKRRGKNERD